MDPNTVIKYWADQLQVLWYIFYALCGRVNLFTIYDSRFTAFTRP
jgi:hypothetical protein